MPRIKQIKVYHFNEKQDIPSNRFLLITDSLHLDLVEAISWDYPSTDDTSEYCAMLRADTPMTAAKMLQGATEVAHIDAVVCGHRFNGTAGDWQDAKANDDDFQKWLAYHQEHGVECSTCGAFTYGDDLNVPETCNNCLEDI